MSDPQSRATKGELIPIEIKTALDGDFVERNRRVTAALNRRFGLFMDSKLQKKVTINMLALRFTKIPKLVELSGKQNSTDTYGNARPSRTMTTQGAAQLIHDLACAAFPELKWDIAIDVSMDLTEPEFVNKLCAKITASQNPKVSIDVCCTLFSVARFKPGGKRPLRRRSTNGTIPDLSTDERIEIDNSDACVQAAIQIAHATLSAQGSFIMENCADRGGCIESNPLQ